jgi:hypothetical protein
VLTRIVNAHWGGEAVFVIGDDSGQIWRCEMAEGRAGGLVKMSQFGEDNSPVEISPGLVLGASFARVTTKDAKGNEIQTPTFVLGGIDNQLGDFGDDGLPATRWTAGMIKISNNGINWTTVFTHDEGVAGTFRIPVNIIWHEEDQLFYLDMAWRSTLPNPFTAVETWSSTTGLVWEMVDRIEDNVINTFFMSKCKYHWMAADMDGIGFANGQFGLDPSKKDSTEHFTFGNVVTDGLLITIEDLANSGSLSNVPVIDFADGTWGRAEFSALGVFDISVDDGKTWQKAGQVTPSPDIPQYGSITAISAGQET